METKDITPKAEEGKKRVFTHGRATVVISHIGAAVIGGAVGAVIKGAEPTPIPPKPTSPVVDVKNDTPDTPTNEINDKEELPEKTPDKDNVNSEEPKPTDSASSEDKVVDNKNDGEVGNSGNSDNRKDNTNGEEGKNVAQNPEQEEIDKIAEDLINGSNVDERDIADLHSMLDGSYPMLISLENGLEVVGFPFNDCGFDLVLLDLDGDGIYGDVLANIDGELRRFDLPMTLNDGREIAYDELIASMHISNSDIEQLLNDDDYRNDLAMTDDDRKRLENDNPLEDIVNLDKSNENEKLNQNDTNDDIVASLTKEEEDELLKDILGDDDEGDIDDSELEALLTGHLGEKNNEVAEVTREDYTDDYLEDIDAFDQDPV